MKDEIIAAVAQGWCTKENENKTMDSTLAMAIVDNVMVVIEKLEKLEGNYRKMITEVIECHPQRVENGENEPPWELVKRIRLENEKLEATITKHERREDSHVKRIEELISSKGIKELEAVAEAAKELHEWIIDKALICPDKRLAAALKEAGYLK